MLTEGGVIYLEGNMHKIHASATHGLVRVDEFDEGLPVLEGWDFHDAVLMIKDDSDSIFGVIDDEVFLELHKEYGIREDY